MSVQQQAVDGDLAAGQRREAKPPKSAAPSAAGRQMEEEVSSNVRMAPPPCLLHGTLPVLLVLLIESGLFTLWHLGALDRITIAALHLLASLLPLVTVRNCGQEGRDERLAWLGSLMVLTLGPVGALGTLWATLMYAHYRRDAKPFDEWYRSILPQRDVSRSEHLVERLSAWGQREEGRREPVPFPEILSNGTRADKQLAIALMARNYNPAFAPAFKQALADKDNAVRVQAASAITRIEENFLQAAMRLEKQVERRPNSLKAWRSLAEHYDSHANAGLSDEESIANFLRKAEEAYTRVLAFEPDDYTALWAMGRLTVKSKDYAGAVALFELAFVFNPEAGVTDRIWYWEALYRERRFADLRREVQTHVKDLSLYSHLPPNIVDSLALWSGQFDPHRVEPGPEHSPVDPADLSRGLTLGAIAHGST